MADLKPLKLQRSQLKASLTRAQTFIEKCNENTSLSQIRSRLSSLIPLLNEFNTVQSTIEALDEEELESEERELFENRYYNLEDAFQQRLASLNTTLNGNEGLHEQPNQNFVKLPTIDLPKFSGSYEDWLTFYDTFNALINANHSIPPIQKFHYLKSCLKGDAANVLYSLEISADNYAAAWSMLEERYNNKRLIVQRHIKAIFDLPVAYKENGGALRQILDGVIKHIRALTTLKRPTEYWDDLIIFIVSKKLDSTTFKEWETAIQSSELPTFQDLSRFLMQKCQTLEMIVKPNSFKTITNMVTNKPFPSCVVCKKNHLLYQCSKFIEMDVKRRIEEIKAKKLCFNCLRSNHASNQCTSKHNCKTCNKKHNTLLHISQENTPAINAGPSQPAIETLVSNHSSATASNTQVLLCTALVNLQDANGRSQAYRALLDPGSQSNLITYRAAKALGLPFAPTQVSLTGVASAKSVISHAIDVTMKSRSNGYQTNVRCLVLEKISERLPLVSIRKEHISIPKNIKLADPNFNISGDIDILLGVQLFFALMCQGQINLGPNHPCLQKTLLGWIVAGSVNVSPSVTVVCNLTTLENLNSNITKFWELEDVRHRSGVHTLEQRLCEQHFQQNTQRDSDGRFIVSLPFKKDPSVLTNSRDQAQKRFYSLEKKLKANPQLKQEYSAFMQEYLHLGHMKLVNHSPKEPNHHFYLPHHAVIKENSLTTKVRVVFDGSAKTVTGISLNDILMVGPKLQSDLFDIVCRFRFHKYAITADIAKMYRQVRVSSDSTPFQRILWRESDQHEIQTFELQTVTYGTASASYLAIKALQELAAGNRHTFELGSNIIQRDFYVDDLLTGSNDINEAQDIIAQCNSILSQGKFELRKWASNEPSLLKGIPKSDSGSTILDLDKTPGISTLGLQWNAGADILQYSIVSPTTQRRTSKRHILSEISKIFDPLGLIGPLIIKAKIMIQRLWQLKLDWDESLPVDISNEWQLYINEIQHLSALKVNRRIMSIDIPDIAELHGFCDSSERAYGACIYVRTVSETGAVSCNLLCSKSKVAPLKSTTLPRLELCAALLLAQLMHRLKTMLHVSISKCYYWTDSSIALSWIKSTSRTWKTFVANRVSQIQELSAIDSWWHIGTKENPADVVSRGCAPSVLINDELWWHGPKFLELQNEDWPLSDVNVDANVPEAKSVACLVKVNTHELDLFDRYSSFNKLIRVVAYCQRFVRNVKARIAKSFDEIKAESLSTDEMSASTTVLLKIAQIEAFATEYQQLLATGKVNRKSNLLSLNPFIDSDGLIRVGGRLGQANIPYQARHQILLPSKHPVTKLIIRQEHIRQLHSGAQLTIASVRAKYWPISVRNTTRAILRRCVTCFRAKPRASQYLMGDLPAERITATRAFNDVGVDYFGPLHVRPGKRRNGVSIKTYGAVFVCLATKAVHLELVGDLTTASFLGALRRFIARRGKMATIYSDNGTQFVGANRELAKLMKQFVSQQTKGTIVETLAAEGITWRFIPPRAPHFGGLWEAAVKSIKTHLHRVIGKNSLNYEEMYTLLVQIEGVLNSRPITPLSNDPNDMSFLTPSHFLTGEALTYIAEPSTMEMKTNSLSRWQYIQRLKEHFWKRWKREYLHCLQTRSKWKTKGEDTLKPGSLVLIQEDKVPSAYWTAGRIAEVFPGTDGIIRTATVKTKSGVIQRPASKLCVLPIDC